MTKGNNYPVVYAVMELTDYADWAGEDTIAFIASKAYLIGEKTKYNSEGIMESEYEVVFPYRNIESVKVGNRHYPEFGIRNECYNSVKVNSIFTDIESGREEAEIKNQKLLADVLRVYPSFRKKAVTIDFYKRLQQAKVLEECIETAASDMTIAEIEMPKKKVKE